MFFIYLRETTKMCDRYPVMTTFIYSLIFETNGKSVLRWQIPVVMFNRHTQMTYSISSNYLRT